MIQSKPNVTAPATPTKLPVATLILYTLSILILFTLCFVNDLLHISPTASAFPNHQVAQTRIPFTERHLSSKYIQWLPSISLSRIRPAQAPYTPTSLDERLTITTLFSYSNPMARLTIIQHHLPPPAPPSARAALSPSVLRAKRQQSQFPT